MSVSLHDYYDRMVWVNLTVYIAYFLLKYVSGVVLGVISVIRKCRRSHSQPQPSTSGNEAASKRPSLPCLVLLVFGKQLGLKDASKLHKLFIKDTDILCHCGQITVFYIVILGSVVLALGTALDLSLFSVTRVCTEDPIIDCYPQLLNDTVNATGLDISVDKPIQDCTFWNSVGVSNRVTFMCFQHFFNFDYFLAVSGGLLAFAFIVLNAMTGFLLRVTQCSVNKLKPLHMLVIRIFLIVVTVLVDIALAILCLVLGVDNVTPDSINDSPATVFLAMHSSVILVVVGTIATLLWLPWEEYVKHQRDPTTHASPIHLTPNDMPLQEKETKA